MDQVGSWTRRKQDGSVRFCIVRHAERADTTFEAEESSEYQFDTHLSREGLRQAEDFAKSLAKKGEFHKVISSPYIRCVETALPICRALKIPLLIDQSWGEIRSEGIFGETFPDKVTRDMPTIMKLCKNMGVKVKTDRMLGTAPVFPESERAANRRFGEMFLTYLDRARLARRGFVVVTHGHALPASAALFSGSKVGEVVAVPFVGHIIGELDVASLAKPDNRLAGLSLIEHNLICYGQKKEFAEPTWLRQLQFDWREPESLMAQLEHSLGLSDLAPQPDLGGSDVFSGLGSDFVTSVGGSDASVFGDEVGGNFSFMWDSSLRKLTRPL